jgi:hypothetical protein
VVAVSLKKKEIDGELPPQVLEAVRALPQVQQAKPLRF